MCLRSSRIAALGLIIIGFMPLGGAAQDIAPDTSRSTREVSPRALGSNCVLNRVSFRTENKQVTTTSTVFVNIPNTAVSFTQSVAGCVIVRYTAETYSPSNAGIDVRARLDGVTTGAPGFVLWTSDHDEDADGQGFSVYAFDFVFPSVAAGGHTVRMQWRSTSGFATARMFFRALTVQHR